MPRTPSPGKRRRRMPAQADGGARKGLAGALVPEVVEVGSLGAAEHAAMFRLYARYYQPARPEVFAADLRGKDRAVLLRDRGGGIQGFSTIRTWGLDMPWGRQRVIFSGDTVIARKFWGSRTLPLAWIEHAGRVHAGDPQTPLWWFLIAKGHRTYRLMPGFARAYFPRPERETPPRIEALLFRLGEACFGDRFDPGTGVVRHSEGDAALKAEFAGDKGRRANNPLAAFFEARNPGHAQGDELLCLCELSEENLRPGARESFLRGYALGRVADPARRRQA